MKIYVNLALLPHLQEKEDAEEEGRLLGILHTPSVPLALRVRGDGPETLFLQQKTTAGPSKHPFAASLSPLNPSLSSPSPPSPSPTSPPKPHPDPPPDPQQPTNKPTPAPDGSAGVYRCGDTLITCHFIRR